MYAYVMPKDTKLTIEAARNLLEYNTETGHIHTKIGRKGCAAGTRIGTAAKTPGGYWYYRARINYKMYLLHRLAWFLQTGEWPNVIDHLNGNGLDNRWCNLREGDNSKNMRNQRISSRNTTGIVGIYSPSGRSGIYQAYISTRKGRKHLYYGNNFFEACCRRKAAELKHNYHENHGKHRQSLQAKGEIP